MNVEEIRQTLGIETPPSQRTDGIWWHIAGLNVCHMAQYLIQNEARLITITAIPDGKSECRLIYHWDCQGQLLHLSTLTQGRKIDSVAAICPAADWIEREIHDLFGVIFNGRETSPLVLRASDPSGLFLANIPLDEEGKE
ncbi:MAG: hypothetical protein DDG59_06235 [Anaerolineae bacterium]|jgi:NADH:ubiquinone oxidoreductase subunit C|nr:MAG: hypothetical protein DDG59_06235 [Anaerolineae bacterium]